MHPDVDLNKVAQITEGFTGADLQAILYTAHINSSDTSALNYYYKVYTILLFSLIHTTYYM